ncbi:hypothetical protein [Pseudactinotalea suaedae]|uniref:hypothetical protein n=1 Tax=Pseudactinotalea suaedae TaxID=1524924 RepID=UPI0012E17F07|nr:hypothetical protein [Pseudactinotalea suaedae]
MSTQVTRAQAVAAAGAALAAGYEQLDSLPLAEAVDRAWTPTGPSREELADRIRARRLALGLMDAPQGRRSA